MTAKPREIHLAGPSGGLVPDEHVALRRAALEAADPGHTTWLYIGDGRIAAIVPPETVAAAQKYWASQPADRSEGSGEDMTVRLGMVVCGLLTEHVIRPVDIGLEPDFTGNARDIARWLRHGR